MKTKSITLLFIVSLLLIAALTSCSKNASLSDAEALRIIQQSGRLSVVSILVQNIKGDSPLGQELSRLLKEGFLTEEGITHTGVPAPAKAAGIVGPCYWNSMFNVWVYANFLGLQPKPTKITSKLIDSKSGTAVVRYEVSWTPTDYLTKLCQLDPNELPAFVSQVMSQCQTHGEITLKLWDNGWHPQ